jgi:hypothetical protein
MVYIFVTVWRRFYDKEFLELQLVDAQLTELDSSNDTKSEKYPPHDLKSA